MSRIAELIARELHLNKEGVAHAVNLLEDGATVPFISRYRKEATGGLDDVALQNIDMRLRYYRDLEKRRSSILKSIEAQGQLTPELAARINACYDAVELEDLYLPYKPKRKTRAEAARQLGLEPLADIIMRQDSRDDIIAIARQYVSDNVADEQAALAGARDIIAERVSETKRARDLVRDHFRTEARLNSHYVKGKEIEGRNYEAYYDFRCRLRSVRAYQFLAIRRGEKEGFLRVSIDINDEQTIQAIAKRFIKNKELRAADEISLAVDDAYKRLIRPAIENEFLAKAKHKADDESITNFAANVRQLLFAPPLGPKRVLAIDPGMRTGCKVVCLDATGHLLAHDVIYPNSPHNDIEGSRTTLMNLVEKFGLEAIALGNGTGSRETQRFLSNVPFPRHLDVHVVSEDGASIYSASQVARDEFPNEDVTVRGAVSIGRRLIDPLAELIKIDPKSLGVGQYQHDVDQTALRDALNYVVEGCVNSVGVNLNTASVQLLTFVSGLGPVLAQSIVNYRKEHGGFTSREQLLEVPRLGKKTYVQAAGFLRVPESSNPLDNSAVHPERYALVERMAQDAGCTVSELIANPQLRSQIDIDRYIDDSVGRPTLLDIMAELDKPGRDPRQTITTVEFDDNVNSINDLHEGMLLNGVVTNVTDFGAFVDIGVHNDGLIHASRLTGKGGAVKLHIGQILRVRVVRVDTDRNRIGLAIHRSNRP